MTTPSPTEAFPLGRLRGEVDHLFQRFFGEAEPLGVLGAAAIRHQPAINLRQDDYHLHIESELPGVREEDIEVSLAGEQLTITGHRDPDQTVRGGAIERRERRTGPFRLVIHLPVAVDPGRVEATLASGVLSIRLTKAARARTRRIPVRFAGD